MKKLGKLSINPDRVLKNEELVNLRGGDYYGYAGCYTCTVTYESGSSSTGGCCASSASVCQELIKNSGGVQRVSCS